MPAKNINFCFSLSLLLGVLHAIPIKFSEHDRFRNIQSNTNNVFSSGPISCQPFNGVSISVETTSDLISDLGFSIQLNGYSPTGFKAAWQQYGFTIDSAGVGIFAENWMLPVVGTNNLFNFRIPLISLPSPPTVPSGYQLLISLNYDDNDYIIGAEYSVTNQNSNTLLGSYSLPLNSITGFDPTWYAPLAAFELNIVGPYNLEKTTFTVGSGGNIIYSSI